MRKRILAGFILFLTVTTAGCWDLRDPDRLAYATTIGIDREPRDQIRLTIQLPITQNLLPPGYQSSGGGQQFSLASLKGISVDEAFHKLQTMTYRDLAVGQNKSVIVGTEAAEKDMRSLLNYLTRDAQAPPQSLVMVADGASAAEVLALRPSTQNLPGLEFFQTAQIVDKYDRTYFIPIWEFHQRLIHESKDPYAPLIAIDRKVSRYILSGLAVFSGNRLAGKLSERETQAFGMLVSLMRSGHMAFRLSSGETVTLRNVQAKTRIKVVRNQVMPEFIVRTRIRGSISEWTGGQRLIRQPELRYLQLVVARSVHRDLVRVIRKLQEYNADVINFGEQLRVQDNRFWKKADWRRIYPRVPVVVRVDVKIVSDGTMR